MFRSDRRTRTGIASAEHFAVAGHFTFAPPGIVLASHLSPHQTVGDPNEDSSSPTLHHHNANNTPHDAHERPTKRTTKRPPLSTVLPLRDPARSQDATQDVEQEQDQKYHAYK